MPIRPAFLIGLVTLIIPWVPSPAFGQDLDATWQQAKCEASQDPLVRLSEGLLAGAAGGVACSFFVGPLPAIACGAVIGGITAFAPHECDEQDWSNQVEGDMFFTPDGDIYERTGNVSSDSVQEYRVDEDSLRMPDTVLTNNGQIWEHSGDWEGIPGAKRDYLDDELTSVEGDIYFSQTGEIYERTGSYDQSDFTF